MTLSGHLSAASLVLVSTQNPWLAVPLCLLLHYIADAIPHAEWRPWRKATAVARFLMVADTAATIALAWLMAIRFPGSPWLVSAAVVASILPDLIDPFTRRKLPTLRYIHVLLHSWPQKPIDPIDWGKTATGRTPTAMKVSLQIALVLFSGVLTVFSSGN